MKKIIIIRFEASDRRQRFRKSIPYGHVQSHGELVLKIENGVITYRDDGVIPRCNSRLNK